MKEGHRVIFRDTALRHYALGRARSVLPQFASPRLMILLWIVTGILFGCGLLAWSIRIPVYVSGPGVVDLLHEGEGGHRIAIFLPVQERFRIHIGQRAFCTFDMRGERVRRNLVAVDSQVTSPSDAHIRFRLTGAAAAGITKPVVIAYANLEPLPGNLPASAYAGSVCRFDVEVGTMRAISLLPFIKRFFPVNEA